MKRLALTLVFALAGAGAAFAHAQLESASPPVGGTVDPPAEIRITFSEAVEPAFCSLTLTSANGAAQPVSKASVSPSNHKVLIVKLGNKLAPGAYGVKWRAVSVDTHHTQGSFEFTVK